MKITLAATALPLHFQSTVSSHQKGKKKKNPSDSSSFFICLHDWLTEFVATKDSAESQQHAMVNSQRCDATFCKWHRWYSTLLF